MAKIKVVYLNVDENKGAEFVQIEDEPKTYYELLRCDAIDIVQRPIGKKKYCIVVDDEGLLKKRRLSAYTVENSAREDFLVGNLVIAGLPTEEGELTSLTKKEARQIARRVYKEPTWPNGVLLMGEVV